MKKVLLALIFTFSISAFSETDEMDELLADEPTSTQQEDIIGTIQKTDPAIEADLKKQLTPKKKQKTAEAAPKVSAAKNKKSKKTTKNVKVTKKNDKKKKAEKNKKTKKLSAKKHSTTK